jgi:hypothetical protein
MGGNALVIGPFLLHCGRPIARILEALWNAGIAPQLKGERPWTVLVGYEPRRVVSASNP